MIVEILNITLSQNNLMCMYKAEMHYTTRFWLHCFSRFLTESLLFIYVFYLLNNDIIRQVELFKDCYAISWLYFNDLQLDDVAGDDFENLLNAFGQLEKRQWVQCVIISVSFTDVLRELFWSLLWTMVVQMQ